MRHIHRRGRERFRPIGLSELGRQHTLEFRQLAILRADIQRLNVEQRILNRYPCERRPSGVYVEPESE